MLVEHNILDKELMLAYDVEEGVQRALVSYAKHTNVQLTREFVMEAPLKVLHTVSQIRNKWDAKAGLGLNQESKCEDLRGGVKEPSGIRKRMREDKEGEGTPAKQSCQQEPLTEGSTKGSSQVATKNDDAPVDVSDWDIWTVNKFEPLAVVYSKGKVNARVMFKENNPATALVCVSRTYNPEMHGCLFDALQGLLIWRAKHNAFKGLIKYLRAKYGGSMVCEEVVYKPRKSSGIVGVSRPKNNLSGRRLPRDRGRLIAFEPSGKRTFLVHLWVWHERITREPSRKRRSDGMGPAIVRMWS